MRISHVSNGEIKEYCGMTEDCGNLEIYKASALSFIAGNTGLSEDEIDEHEDLTLAWLALINDMSLNREYAVKRDTLNPCVQTILGMYSKNYVR